MTLLKTKKVVMPTNSDVKESEKHLVPSSARLKKKKFKKGNSLWHSISLFLFFVVALKKANPNASDQKMLHKTTS